MRPERMAAYMWVLSRLLSALWLPPLLGFSLLLLGLSMTPILMSVLLGLLGKLPLSLALLVGLLLAGLLLTTLQLLSGLDSTGTAGSVAPCAARREKDLHVVQEKRQALQGERERHTDRQAGRQTDTD